MIKWFNELLTITSVKLTKKPNRKTEEIPIEDLSDIPTGNKAEGTHSNENEPEVQILIKLNLKNLQQTK